MNACPVGDDPQRSVLLPPAHGSEPGLEPAVVSLNTVVHVLHSDVPSAGQHVLDDARVGGGPIGAHLRRRPGSGKRTSEEPPGGLLVPLGRHQHVDDLAELVDRPV